MSNYVYTCACCGTAWDRTSSDRHPTKLELARMVCQPCRMAPKRIAALEAEAARWREAHDKIIAASAERANECDANLRDAREEMEALRAENAALREDKARLEKKAG